MTHTLHRKGNKNDLKEDFIILSMLAREINDNYDDSRQKLIRIAEIMNEHNPINIMPEFGWKTSSTITAVFDNLESIKRVVDQLKKEDLGISIVISGLISEIKDMLKDLDLNIHTVHFSIGTFGKKEDLPGNKILEITTMCGHHCISPLSVEYYIDLIKKGKISTDKAAQKITRPCVCGIVNTSRVIKIFRSLVNE
ncbi:MAG: hypothetical protein ACFFCI_22385 [Promethearchaeota archaeon]